MAAEERARHLLSRAENEFRERGLLVDELHAVLLVGGHSSNGWVAEHDGRRSLFLALEYLGTPPYDDLLVVHELSHVVQGRLSPATRARTYASSLAVMVEGSAAATSRVLRPGHTNGAYLWMDDDSSVAPLLRNQASPAIPARSGYWAGDLIARAMLQDGCRLDDLLSIGPAEARDYVLEWAERNRG